MSAFHVHQQLARGIIIISCLSEAKSYFCNKIERVHTCFGRCCFPFKQLKESQLTWTQDDDYSMDAKIKSHTKCTANKHSKGSLVALVISILLAILFFVRIELVHRKSEATVAQLAFRIHRIEEEMQDKIQNRIMEILQSKVMPASKEKRRVNFFNSVKLLYTLLDVLLDALHKQYNTVQYNTIQYLFCHLTQHLQHKMEKWRKLRKEDKWRENLKETTRLITSQASSLKITSLV